MLHRLVLPSMHLSTSSDGGVGVLCSSSIETRYLLTDGFTPVTFKKVPGPGISGGHSDTRVMIKKYEATTTGAGGLW